MFSRSFPIKGITRRLFLQGFPGIAGGLTFGTLTLGVSSVPAQAAEATRFLSDSAADPHIINPTPSIMTDLPSTTVDQVYRLFIALPQSYHRATRHYPAIYVLDGNALFGPVRDAVEFLQIPQEMPEVVIVGIGYPEPTYMDTLGLRGRDMTFTELSPVEAEGYPFEETGGGLAFLEVIEQEVIPLLEENYRINPEDRALVGWSLGGDFVLYALFHRPELFRRLGALSPDVRTVVSGIPVLEADYSAVNKSLPARLFVSKEDASMGLQNFVETLETRNYEGLQLTAKYYEDENHFSMVPRATMDFLRAVYG